MKTYFSNRIYKKTLPEKFVAAIEHALLLFNQAKWFSHSTLVKEGRSKTSRLKMSLHNTVKAKYGLNDYYANSAVQEGKATKSSQDELKKLYISNCEAQIVSVEKKIKTSKSRLTTLRKIKKSFVKDSPIFNKTSPEQQCGRFFIVKHKKHTQLFYSGYLFEHQYLDPKIKFMNAQIGRFEFRLNRLKTKLQNLKTKKTASCFGTKALFKKQHSVEKYANNHDAWLKDFRAARTKSMTISGRKDAKYGNFVFTYLNHELSFLTPNGTPVQIPGVVFPYGQLEVENAISNQISCKNKKLGGKPIAWSVEDHGKYFIFKTMIEETVNTSINISTADGVIGIDCNYNHFAISNINSKGQLLRSFVREFDIEGKTTGQITKILEAEAIAIVEYASLYNKPIVLERLNTTTSKASGRYRNKKANLHMSMFAYKKMIDSIVARAKKMGVHVIFINPAYTSQIGKMKYMKRYRISIHQAASFVIGRRGMRFKEKLPPVLYNLDPEKMRDVHHWAQWRQVSAILKGIRTHAFYRSEFFNNGMVHDPHELFSTGALTDLELNNLPKLKKQKRSSS